MITYVVVYFSVVCIACGVSVAEYGTDFSQSSAHHAVRGMLWPMWILMEAGYHLSPSTMRDRAEQRRLERRAHQATYLMLKEQEVQARLTTERMAEAVIAQYDYEILNEEKAA